MNNTAMTHNSRTSTRVTHAVIGFALILPVVASLGLSPLVTFGLAFAGTCMVLNAIIGLTPVESYAVSAGSFAVIVAGMSNVNLTEPATLAAASLITIAAITTSLIGFRSDRENDLSLQQVGVTNVGKEHYAANDTMSIAA